MSCRAGLAFVLSLLPLAQASAQLAGSDASALRRTAVYSALASRASREGELKVGLCSVVRAVEVSSAVRAAAPASIGASLVGNGAGTCPARGGAQTDGPWVPFGEVVSAEVSTSPGGGLHAVVVLLRVWEDPGTFTDETYDFIANRDSLWREVKFQRMRGYINLAPPPNPNILVLLNGQIVHAATPLEVLDRLRGQVVDSVRVVAARDSSFAAMFGSKAVNGGVIIGTRSAGRRP